VLSDSHPFLSETLISIANKSNIPFHIDAFPVRPIHSATDAYAMQVTRQGIATVVLSIPLRYMHTPVEVATLNDIRNVGRLLYEVILMLDEAFLDKITMDSKQ
jgi:putative aminopeptidase FrvX